ncbi:hypothetical protein VTN00DRAFT_5388 [Thermoascus crustaceus]|uniref:uncharacterized protein n=1 Tax=Thermoascus crustaceus TaxID=5088 RepID=UPI003743F3BC
MKFTGLIASLAIASTAAAILPTSDVDHAVADTLNQLNGVLSEIHSTALLGQTTKCLTDGPVDLTAIQTRLDTISKQLENQLELSKRDLGLGNINSNANVNSNANINGNSNINGNGNINGEIKRDLGTSDINSNGNINGNGNVHGNTDVNGNGNSNIDGNTNVNDNIKRDLGLGSINSNANANVNGGNIHGTANINANIKRDLGEDIIGTFGHAADKVTDAFENL